MYLFKIPVVTLLLSFALTFSAHATTLLPVDASQAVDEADLIFIGQAVAHEVHLTVGDRTPFTFVTFTVDEVLKGRVEGNEVTLRFFGGPVDNEIIVAEGMPEFEHLGRYLLFVDDNGRSFAPLVGWGQGRLEFKPHPVTGLDMLLDHRGVPVNGVADGLWTKSQVLRLGADGLFAPQKESGVETLWQDGVIIEDGEDEAVRKASEYVTTAATVVEEIRYLVHERSVQKSFKPGELVKSAYSYDLPAALTFEAVAPKN